MKMHKEYSSFKNPRFVLIVLVAFFYALLWIGGAASHLFKFEDRRNHLATLFLSLAAALILLTTRSKRDVFLLALIALFGFLAEVSGVYSGLPFGEYNYTETLKPCLLGVPVVMGLAWLNLIAYVKQMISAFDMNIWAQSVAGGAWMTAIDLVIDPLAANQLGYWQWQTRGVFYGVPAINFAGWFVTSFLIFFIFRKKFKPNPTARLVGISIILFFTLLAFAHALYPVALIGAGLLVIHIFISNAGRERNRN